MKGTIQSLMLNVVVNLATGSVATAGFGIPLYVGRNATFSEYSRAFTSLDEVLVGTGLTTADPEYIAARSAFANGAKTIRIGRIADRVAQVDRVTINTAHSGNWVWSLTDETGTYGGTVTTTTQTAAQTAAAIEAAIAAATDIPVDVAYDSGDAYFDLTALIAGRGFTFTLTAPTGGAKTIAVTTENVSVGDELTKLQDENDSWFALEMVNIADDGHDEDIWQAAQWASAQPLKVQIAQSSDAEILVDGSTINIAYKVQAAGYENTKVGYHASTTEQMDAGAIANFLSIDQDTQTVGFNLTPSIGSTADDLTKSQCQNVIAKGAHVFVSTSNGSTIAPLVREGSSEQYKWFANVVTRAWFNQRLQEAFLSLAVLTRQRKSKIPQDDGGYTMLQSCVRQVYQMGVAAGKFRPDTLVFTLAPTRAQVAALYPAWLEAQSYTMEFNVGIAGEVTSINATANLSY